MDNQQRPAVEHRELCSGLCASPDGRGVGGRMGTCMCMAESLRRSPETMTTLLIGYTPIQNVFGVKKKREKKRISCKRKEKNKMCFSAVSTMSKAESSGKWVLEQHWLKLMLSEIPGVR